MPRGQFTLTFCLYGEPVKLQLSSPQQRASSLRGTPSHSIRQNEDVSTLPLSGTAPPRASWPFYTHNTVLYGRFYFLRMKVVVFDMRIFFFTSPPMAREDSSARVGFTGSKTPERETFALPSDPPAPCLGSEWTRGRPTQSNPSVVMRIFFA